MDAGDVPVTRAARVAELSEDEQQDCISKDEKGKYTVVAPVTADDDTPTVPSQSAAAKWRDHVKPMVYLYRAMESKFDPGAAMLLDDMWTESPEEDIVDAIEWTVMAAEGLNEIAQAMKIYANGRGMTLQVGGIDGK
jgi:hypothetical protein